MNKLPEDQEQSTDLDELYRYHRRIAMVAGMAAETDLQKERVSAFHTLRISRLHANIAAVIEKILVAAFRGQE